MRVVYMGTPAFSAQILEGLVVRGLNTTGVVTQPSRPAGRGRKLLDPPVKTVSMNSGIPVVQPETVRGNRFVYDQLRSWNPDCLLVVAYGLFLPPAMLQMTPYGAINLHASLLPKYRGAAPVNWALINGETITGVSTMRMIAKMDAGPVLGQRPIAIDPAENAPQLFQKMVAPSIDLILDTLTAIADGTAVPREQEESDATFAPMLTKDDGLIDWTQSAEKIHNRIRGLQPSPGGFTFCGGRRLLILAAEPVAGDTMEGEPGTIIREGKKNILVIAGQGTLRLSRVQWEGCCPADISAFLCGCRLETGARFESSHV